MCPGNCSASFFLLFLLTVGHFSFMYMGVIRLKGLIHTDPKLSLSTCHSFWTGMLSILPSQMLTHVFKMPRDYLTLLPSALKPENASQMYNGVNEWHSWFVFLPCSPLSFSSSVGFFVFVNYGRQILTVSPCPFDLAQCLSHKTDLLQ